MSEPRTRAALRRMAADDPELGARLVLMALPAAAAAVPGELRVELELERLGAWRLELADGAARLERPGAATAEARPPDVRIRAEPRALAELASGAGALRALVGGRLRVRGSARKAMRLRALARARPTLRDIARAGTRLEPDLLLRALPYLVDPDWTRGHRFTVRYEIEGAAGGPWHVEVRDGEPLRVSSEADGDVAATVRVRREALERMLSGELGPESAMQRQVSRVEGEVFPVVLLGRWIERSQGRDDAELEREERQRRVQEERAAARSDGGRGARGPARGGEALLDYAELYALWERQNWSANAIDFSVDRRHWLATPTPGQAHMLWSLGQFYAGEERVTADLAPFLLAAPSGEIELFLGTQIVDEARHAAFFDRFAAEVMALGADDVRGRLREVERGLLAPWRELFDDGLRDVAGRLKSRPDDLDLFVEGIATYHMVVEGFLAVTGQTLIRAYLADHGLYPGLVDGFGLVERDEHRHVAFGVRFLRDAIAADARHRATVERVVLELVPTAARSLAPPHADDPSEFVVYGYHSSQLYGLAYRTLRRRMRVLGIAVPPPEELMPGAVDETFSPTEPPAPAPGAAAPAAPAPA
ncbi:MAG: SCP2 sterol-binding domain-containing protein [Nocardioidaceae bacterium]